MEKEKLKSSLINSLLNNDYVEAIDIMMELMQRNSEIIELEDIFLSLDGIDDIMHFFDICKISGDITIGLLIDTDDEESYKVAIMPENDKSFHKKKISYEDISKLIIQIKKTYREEKRIPWHVKKGTKESIVMIKPVELEGEFIVTMMCRKKLNTGILLNPVKITAELMFNEHIEKLDNLCRLLHGRETSSICNLLKNIEYNLLIIPII